MIDMQPTTIPKSDQMNADDLSGGPRTIEIREVKLTTNKEQPVAIYFIGDDGKPYLPCKSMRRVMMAVWDNDASVYVGRSMTLWRDPSVTYGGLAVGGVRIKNMSHMAEKAVVILTETKKTRKPFTVFPLAVAAPATVGQQPMADAAPRVLAEPTEKHRAAVDRLLGRVINAPTLDALRALEADPAVMRGRDIILLSYPAGDREIAAAIASQFAHLHARYAAAKPDPDLGLANAYLAEIAALETAMDVRAWAENGEIKQSMAAWRKDRPELFTAVDGAVAARITGAEDAA